jgi:hypothetical protein
MTYQEALKVIKTVSIYYQNFVITEERVKEWALIIQDYELFQVMDNLKEHARTNKFPPTLADLISTQEQNKQVAYLPNTIETTMIQAEEARQFLEAIEGNYKKLGISFSKEKLKQMIDDMRGDNQ